MAYRSDLDAALARIDAMGPERPCLSCAARAKRHERFAYFVLGVFLYLGAFVLLAFASLAGVIAICALLIGTLMIGARGDATTTPLLVGLLFALLSAGGFAGFFWLERLLRFDVGRFG